MNYEHITTTLLNRIFDNRLLTKVREYNPHDPVLIALSPLEWQRIEWGYWAGAYAASVPAITRACDAYDLDKPRIPSLLFQGYPQRIPVDNTPVVVGDYLRNHNDLKALKQTGAISYSIFSRIESQRTTRGKLASAIAAHRVRTLTAALCEGYVASPRLAHDEMDFFAEISIPTKVRDGLFRTAMVFCDLILDSGHVERNEKSIATTELLSELLQQSYKELFQDITDIINVSE